MFRSTQGHILLILRVLLVGGRPLRKVLSGLFTRGEQWISIGLNVGSSPQQETSPRVATDLLFYSLGGLFGPLARIVSCIRLGDIIDPRSRTPALIRVEFHLSLVTGHDPRGGGERSCR